jgi:hypothetical protein
MSRIKRFGLRLGIGVVMASSLVGGTLAFSTGTASAAPREFRPPFGDISDHMYNPPRFRGNTMLRRELPDHRFKVSLGECRVDRDSKPAHDPQSFR